MNSNRSFSMRDSNNSSATSLISPKSTWTGFFHSLRLSLSENKTFVHDLAQTLVDEGNDDYIETPDFTVELDEVVITDILLNLPQKNLCKEDCKGLCPTCGVNLNTGSCACSGKTVDPRLEILKQLMD